jgi:hypothetical protein
LISDPRCGALEKLRPPEHRMIVTQLDQLLREIELLLLFFGAVPR